MLLEDAKIAMINCFQDHLRLYTQKFPVMFKHASLSRPQYLHSVLEKKHVAYCMATSHTCNAAQQEVYKTDSLHV